MYEDIWCRGSRSGVEPKIGNAGAYSPGCVQSGCFFLVDSNGTMVAVVDRASIAVPISKHQSRQVSLTSNGYCSHTEEHDDKAQAISNGRIIEEGMLACSILQG